MTPREYMRAWKRRNPDKVREYARRRAQTKAFKAYQSAWKKAQRTGVKRADVLAKQRARRARNRDALNAAKRGGGAGLTHAQLTALLNKAAGKCALCRQPHKRLVIDHDHTTGRVRGVLCTACNTFLGYLESRAALIQRAQRYIERYRK